ncbi:MAG: hypothetical protein E3J82_02930 [Candidatus Thorarchaeota archaeon]|nr:MAG: hypothetical protein E3J82_02930 [Candidatus Thorarchaeota archaeon]
MNTETEGFAGGTGTITVEHGVLDADVDTFINRWIVYTQSDEEPYPTLKDGWFMALEVVGIIRWSFVSSSVNCPKFYLPAPYGSWWTTAAFSFSGIRVPANTGVDIDVYFGNMNGAIDVLSYLGYFK